MNTDTERMLALRQAEDQAAALFDEIVADGLIRPGVGERELSDQIRDRAAGRYGVQRHWHKRIVRSGVNTLEPYRSNPPDRRIEADDIVFLDFGPVFAEWEADLGRTYVLGDDPAKHRLVGALTEIWEQGRDHFAARPDITGEQLFEYVRGLMAAGGWRHPTEHAGHQVGEFPHERINGDDTPNYITAGSTGPMRRPDAAGHPCHWILEIHLVDPTGSFGGFYEQLLDI